METAELPQSPSLPLVGSALHYFRDPLGFLDRTAQRGDIVSMRFLNTRAWLVSDPALVEQVLVKNPQSFQKDMFLRELKRVLGEGLLTAEGAFWKRQRRLIAPAFHRERIAGYGRTMVEHTERMVDTWRDGQTLEVHHAMMSLTADIVTRALFGADVANASEVSWCIETLMERFSNPAYLMIPLIDRLPTAANRQYREVAPRLDAIVRGFIESRQKLGDPAPGDDLLAMLLNARDEDGSRMDVRTVRDEVLILFLAGHETTALALSWTLHMLSENPEAERKLHDELDAVLGDRAPSFEDLPKLKYTEMVVQETLRLRPPAWAMGREAIAPIELGGMKFEAGSWLWMIPWVIHRDPRWYPEPERFRPERWEDGFVKTIPKFAYMPFGGGARVCIGNQFAMMEAVLLLASIARRFSLRTAPGHRVVPDPAVTLRFKHGLSMKLTARKARSSA